MNKPSDHPAKIRYKYQMDASARLQTAHGVWGGINPQGEIEMNFYHESDALPLFLSSWWPPMAPSATR